MTGIDLLRLLALFSLVAGASRGMASEEQIPVNTTVVGNKLDQEHLSTVLGAIFPGKRDYKALPLDVRNRIARAAANELSTHTTNGLWINDETVDVLLYRPYVHDTPDESALRHLHWTNDIAITLLRDLSNENLFNAPEVIPPLIRMLDYPGKKQSISNQAAQVLRQLTGRDWDANDWKVDGPYHQNYVTWWRDWWSKNHDKHPVLDDELKTRIKNRIKELQRQLPEDVKAFHETRYLTNDFTIHASEAYGPGCIVDRVVDSSVLSQVIIRTDQDGLGRAIGPDDFIFLRIIARFQTPPPHPRPIEVPQRWQSLLKEVHREVMPGTDVEIAVFAASKNAKFMREMSNAFSRRD